jgi:DNA topoisomerase VI subunit B
LKELVDNALDACESVGQKPEISNFLYDDGFGVRDNGPGIPQDVLLGSLYFIERVIQGNHERW